MTHAINPDILDKNEWKDFVKDRREKLRNLIEKVCGGVFQPFTDTIDLAVQIEEPDEE